MTISESVKIRLGVPVYQDAHHVISVYENTVLTYSIDAPNPIFLDAWARTVALVVDQRQAGLMNMTIIERHVQPPNDVSRTRIRNTVLRHAADIKAFAYVVEGEGFGASAIRSAISLMSMAARYPFPLKVFGHVEDAASWMLNRPGQGAQNSSPAKLIAIANSLRGELSAGIKTG